MKYCLAIKGINYYKCNNMDEFQSIMLSEGNQSQKAVYRKVPCLCGENCSYLEHAACPSPCSPAFSCR